MRLQLIYHVVTDQGTVTFLTEEDRDAFIAGMEPGSAVLCASIIPEEEYARLQEWRDQR